MYPDFLGIGAMRSGSSWLYACLAHHPGIWLPPVKELHYFDMQRGGTRLPLSYRNHMKARAKHYVLTTARLEFDYSRISWDWRYATGRRNDSWYGSLFPAGSGCVSGEITPAYSILAVDDILHIKKLMPDLRVVLLMRNPVDRAWSNVHHNLAHSKRQVEPTDLDSLIALLEAESVRAKSDYVTILGNWESVFGAERIFKGFMDEIQRCPEVLLSRLCGFLGVGYDPQFFPKQAIQRRVGPSKSPGMPDTIREYLARRDLGLLSALSVRFGGYADEWYQDALVVAAGGPGNAGDVT